MVEKLLDKIDIDLASRAKQVLGNSKSAERWLSTPLKPLSYQTPYQVFKKQGPEQLYQILGRIEHGVYS